VSGHPPGDILVLKIILVLVLISFFSAVIFILFSFSQLKCNYCGIYYFLTIILAFCVVLVLVFV